jgi:IS5 family transposase
MKHQLPPLFVFPGDFAEQTQIRLPLPIVKGNRDYMKKEDLLIRMNEILLESGVEKEFLQHAVREARSSPDDILSDRRRDSVQHYAKQALRCTIARILSNESHRLFSVHLAESPLLQWFCCCSQLDFVQVPSKSTIQRMESGVSTETVTLLSALLLQRSRDVDANGESILGLADPVDLSVIWMDATCAKLNIHYPVDWTLLCDGTKSIMRAIMVIRNHGLKHRMPDPESFISVMNQQAMAMTGGSRRGPGKDKARARKKVLRTMKRVARKVQEHGRRYRDLLQKDWNETDLSEPQVQQIINRINNILDQFPAAIKQAHERIIGERKVPSDEKILSLYEPHSNIYVRGKSGSHSEFGLQMLLTESAEGLIVDCQLIPDGVANDSTLLMPTINRIRDIFDTNAAKVVVTDRGFSSAANSLALKNLNIGDSTLPRSPEEMKKLLEDPEHRKLHKRRAQTEARIGIFKANFLGDHLPTKGLPAQQRFVAWAKLAHNLWVLARLDTVVKISKTG